jgi:hypothetical protein
VVHAGAGLRARLWFACLLGGSAGAAAVVGLFSWLAPQDPLFNPMTLGIWPWSAAAACLVIALTLGLWLDHGIAAHLRGLSRAIATGDPTPLGSLPAAVRWGELSLLTAQLQSLLVRQRELGRAVFELEELRHRIRGLRTALELRPRGQGAEPLRTTEGPLAPLVETLNRHAAAELQAREEGREDALQLHQDLALAIVDARDSAEQAERGFIEATALLTSVRELQRLGVDLQLELSSGADIAGAGAAEATPPGEAQRLYREAAAAAIEELVSASSESVEHLAAGLVRVQEISASVQAIANRATLIALDVALPRGGPPAGAEEAGAAPVAGETSSEARSLAREVRSLTDRTVDLSRAVDQEVAAAVERMKGLRARVAAKLDAAPPVIEPAPGAPGPGQPSEAALRLLDRVREMVQDAAAKGEGLSATGERASRAAARLVRRLDDEAGGLERLAARMGVPEEDLRWTEPEAGSRTPPSFAGPSDTGEAAPRPADEESPGGPGATDLRLLGPDDVAREADEPSADPQPGGEGEEWQP